MFERLFRFFFFIDSWLVLSRRTTTHLSLLRPLACSRFAPAFSTKSARRPRYKQTRMNYGGLREPNRHPRALCNDGKRNLVERGQLQRSWFGPGSSLAREFASLRFSPFRSPSFPPSLFQRARGKSSRRRVSSSKHEFETSSLDERETWLLIKASFFFTHRSTSSFSLSSLLSLLPPPPPPFPPPSTSSSTTSTPNQKSSSPAPPRPPPRPLLRPGPLRQRSDTPTVPAGGFTPLGGNRQHHRRLPRQGRGRQPDPPADGQVRRLPRRQRPEPERGPGAVVDVEPGAQAERDHGARAGAGLS